LVLTGGPSSGKTTLTYAIQRAYEGRVAIVPEAASILFRGGFRRRTYPDGVKHQQRAIYSLQVEHEAICRIEHPHTMLVCDRGTVDGLAYWPQDGTNFLTSVESRIEDELARYDWVIHMDTANSQHYDSSNKIRVESHSEADEINSRVKKAWELHPRRFTLPAAETFAHKICAAVTIVGAILDGESFDEIHSRVLTPL
jgi:predicted ATPase